MSIVHKEYIAHLRFADGIVLMVELLQDLRKMLSSLNSVPAQVWLGLD